MAVSAAWIGSDATFAQSQSPPTSALNLVIQIGQNEARAVQKFSSDTREYALTAMRATIEAGRLVVMEDVSVYATIYCVFDGDEFDAGQIEIGKTAIYRALLERVETSQKFARLGNASGVVNFHEVLLSGCQYVGPKKP
jgi:hypothetical protein